ncbi:hypothetical protein [Streptomyces sp. NPDC059575]|uniref:hypothetical protein n=1 Tax=Streptomyces sp. NPDC059575 TaxID=3346872 RepID=UPI0036CFFD7A
MPARRTAAALCASLALLTGCGSDTGAAPLSAKQAEAVLPDAEALPGWNAYLDPAAYPLKKAQSIGASRCQGEGRISCAHVQIAGASGLRREGEPELSFFIQTYEDSDAAKSAYPAVWKAWSALVPKARAVRVGDLGEQSDAVAGWGASGAEGSKGTLVQVRVGDAIMLTSSEALPDVRTTDAFAVKVAGVFAERAEQVRDGETPSAALKE